MRVKVTIAWVKGLKSARFLSFAVLLALEGLQAAGWGRSNRMGLAHGTPLPTQIQMPIQIQTEIHIQIKIQEKSNKIGLAQFSQLLQQAIFGLLMNTHISIQCQLVFS